MTFRRSRRARTVAALAVLTLLAGLAGPVDPVGAQTNTAPTGAPAVTGALRVAVTLEVDTSGIDDADGLTGPSFTHQWIRVADDGTESNIGGATSSTYTLGDADEGERIKVKVTFDDDANNTEVLTSAATGTIAAQAAATGVPSVQNTGGTAATANSELTTAVSRHAQSFTTGPNVGGGYTINAVAVDFKAVGISQFAPADLRVTLNSSDADGHPGDALCELEIDPLSFPAAGVHDFGAPIVGLRACPTLAANTTYHVVIRRVGFAAGVIETQVAAEGAEDTLTPPTGWTIGDNRSVQSLGAWTSAASPNAGPLRIRVDADTVTGPLVRNTRQSTSGFFHLTSEVPAFGQLFTTGDSAGGYALGSVGFDFVAIGSTATASAELAVTLQETDADDPDDPSGVPLCELVDPASFTASGVQVFDAPTAAGETCPVLAASTTYAVVLARGAHSASNPVALNRTGSNDEDALTTATGFTLADNGSAYQSFWRSAATWMVEIRGTGLPPNTPAVGVPGIGGVEEAGETLTASTGDIADGDGLTGVSYEFRWVRVAADDSETDIDGATDSTYMLVDDDVGSTIKVRVTFRDDVGYDETATSDPTGVIAAANKPTISGIAQVGETLTASTENITDSEGLTSPTFVHQWIRVDTDDSEADIGGATDPTYELAPGDEGKRIKVKVTFSDDANNPETRTSDATGIVVAPPTNATGAPEVTGVPRVGVTLGVDTSGIDDPDGLTSPSFTHQWIRVAADDTEADIDGATASTYTLADDDETARVKVRVTFDDDADHSEELTSEATGTIAASAAATGVTQVKNTAQTADAATSALTATAPGYSQGFTTGPVVGGYTVNEVGVDFRTVAGISTAGGELAATLHADSAGAPGDELCALGDPGTFAASGVHYFDAPTGGVGACATLAANTTYHAVVNRSAFTGGGIEMGGTAGGDEDTLVPATGWTIADTRAVFSSGAWASVASAGPLRIDVVAAAVDTPATGAPAIGGALRVGEPLTAVTSGIADVDGLTGVAYAYRWIRVAADDSETGIVGATASTYTLAGADENARIRVRVTFSDDLDNEESLISDATGAVAAAVPGDVFVSNTGRSESHARALDATTGRRSQTFYTGPASGGYVLESLGINFADAPSTAGDVMVQLASSSVGSPGSVFCTLVNPADFTASGVQFFDAPTSGTLCPTLAANTYYAVVVRRSATAGGIELWQTSSDDEDALTPATGWSLFDQSFTYGPGVFNPLIIGWTSDFTSALFDPLMIDVRADVAPTPATGAPTVTGVPRAEATLGVDTSEIADDNGLTDPTFTYQWIRVATGESEVDIDGATGSTYEPTDDDVGQRIKVRVTFTDDDGTTEELTSAATDVIAAANRPTISGIAKVDETLTASTENITDSDGLTSPTYTYQWIRVDTGGTESDIAGADMSTYELTPEDEGKRIKVKVSFSDDANNPETRTSNATDLVASAAVVLVKNTGQTLDATPAFLTGLVAKHAQAFRTGPNLGGYLVTSVGFNFDEIADTAAAMAGLTATLDAVGGDGDPSGTALCTLGAPDTYASSGVNTYTAPTAGDGACGALAANTAYVVVLERTDGATTTIALEATSSTAEDIIEPPTGWSMADGGLQEIGAATWSPTSGTVYSIEVEGVVLAGVLVQNTGRTTDSGLATALVEANPRYAQTFTTGAHAGGYALGSVGFDFETIGNTPTAPAELAVSLLATGDNGAPTGTALCTLVDPASFSASGLHAFDAPAGDGACALLEAATTYAVVIERGTHNPNHDVELRATARGDEDTLTPATGWTLADGIHLGVSGTDDWTVFAGPFKVVVRGVVVPANKPVISGVERVGETLTASVTGIADSDGLSGATFTFQWVRVDTDDSEADIGGATKSTYELTDDDEGKRVKVVVSFTDDGNNPETRAGDPSGVIDPEPNVDATGAPTISGIARVNETLTAETGDIVDDNGLDSVSYRFQWVRVDTDDSEADIGGATNSTYMLTAEDEGKRVKVRVSFNDDKGYPEELTSAPSEPVEAQEGLFLVKNTGQTAAGTGATLGSLRRIAQGFTTGSNDTGYTLSAIGIRFDDVPDISTAGSDLRATLQADRSGDPGSVLCLLSDPESFSSSGVHTFGAPVTGADRCPTLAANTTYYVVLLSMTADETFGMSLTQIDAEDSGGAIGWSIGNNGHEDLAEIHGWSQVAGGSLMIEVEGEPLPPPPVLIKNTGQTAAATGVTLSGGLSRVAQRFTTGANTSGYRLSSIGVRFDTVADTANAGAALLVTLNEESSGNPDSWLCTLSVPATFSSSGVNTFSAPTTDAGECPLLAAGTTYFVVVLYSSSVGSVGVSLTPNDAEDSGGAMGWSIADEGHEALTSSAAWSQVAGGSLMISVRGEPLPPVTLLVKNTGQTLSGSGAAFAPAASKFAQGFTTGADATDFTVRSIGIRFKTITTTSTAGSNLTVTLHPLTSGDPGDALCTLSAPATFSSSGVQTFSAPLTGTGSCPALAVSRPYFVVVDGPDDRSFVLHLTQKDAEDAGGAKGWSIADEGHEDKTVGGWSEYASAALMIEVYGTASGGNIAPTGAPTISGTPRVGEVLTADTSGIADDNGTDSAIFTHQWVRVVGLSETDVGTDSSTYTLTDDDAARRIRVRVGFIDDDGYEEELLSELSAPVEAREAPVLVKNTGQTAAGTGATLSGGFSRAAQGFNTGSSDSRYRLRSIGVRFDSIADTANAGAGLLVTLNEESSGNPDSWLCTLSAPAAFASSGVHTFSAPVTGTGACPLLAAGTTYFVVVLNASSVSAVGVSLTSSDVEDSGGATGWSIGNKGHQALTSSATWSQFAGDSLMIEVRGERLPPVVSLVKNTAQTAIATVAHLVAAHPSRAQAFTTGSRAAGYTLSSIGLRFDDISSTSTAGRGLLVTLNEESSNPGDALCTLSDPATFSTSGVQTFSAPTTGTDLCPTLAADTTYFVVVERTDTGTFGLSLTVSDAEDAGGATGWTIGNVGHRFGLETILPVWSQYGSESLMIEVNGVIPNSQATGVPVITGTPRVGEVLTAHTSGISDDDGTASATFTYQWVRVGGMSETDVGTDSPTYTLTDDDADKRIKVEVSFTDDADNAEGPLVSPPTVAVAGADVLVRNIGQATTSVGVFAEVSPRYGQRFTTGPNHRGYTLGSIGVRFHTIADISTVGSELTVTLNEESSGNPGDALCTLSDPATFSTSGVQTFSAPTTGTDLCPTLAADTTYFVVVARSNPSAGRITWSFTASEADDAGGALGWSIPSGAHEYSGVNSVWTQFSTQEKFLIEVKGAAVVNLSPATGVTISGTTRVGEVLTAGTSGIADDDGTDSATFAYQWIRVDGGTETDVGTDSSTYTLTDEDADKTIKVKVSFTDDAGGSEAPVSPPTETVVAADVVVQNTGQAPTPMGASLDASFPGEAQGFTTAAARYTLGSIGVRFRTIADTSTAGSELTVTLNEESGGEPGDALCTLSDPATFSASGVHTFDAPTTDPCPTLAVSTTYFVVLSRANDDTSEISLDTTVSNDEDSGSLEGWSVQNGALYWDSSSSMWIDDGTIFSDNLDLVLSVNMMIRVKATFVNSTATGAPTIGGAARVNEVLTADTSAISDDDGTASATFTYQWVRVDGMSESDVGTDSPTYTLTDDDAGKKIKVEVTFTDDRGSSEGPLASPPSDAVAGTDVLVQNIGQTPTPSGRHPLDADSPNEVQGFTTGADAAGYTLSSIGIRFHTIADISTAGSELTVMLNEESGGEPGAALCTLSDPETFSASGVHAFDAPTTDPCPTLAAGATYFVVLSRANNDTSEIRPDTSVSTDEDSGSLAGWSMEDAALFWDSTVSAWLDDAAVIDGDQHFVTMLIEVKGAVAREVRLSPSTLTVAEGATGEYTVELSGLPSADVTVSVTGGGDVSVSPGSLTFSTASWNTAQTVTVTAGHDDDAADDTVTVTHAVVDGSAVEYLDATLDGLAVTVTDDEEPGVTLSPSTLTVGEGATGEYTVELSVVPTGDVTVSVTAGGDVTVDPSALTFSTSSWNTAQTVTVTAEHDDDAADDTQTVAHAVVDGSATEYVGETLDGVAVTVSDDDDPGVTLSSSTLTVGEGATGEYTVELSVIPTADVTVSVTSGGDVRVASGLTFIALTFSTSSWNTAQTVTVTAAHDDDAADDTVTVAHAVVDGSAAEYLDATLDGLAVTITDDESPGVTLSPSTLTVTEGGTNTYTVKLSVVPTADVTVSVTAGGGVTVDPSALTFSTSSWNSVQTVTVTGVEDDDAADGAGSVAHAVVDGSATEYVGETLDGVMVTVSDDDDPGVTLSASTLTVAEGATGTYTVKLSVIPTADVTVSVTAGGGVTASPSALTFTTGTWNTAQTVTVTGTEDDDAADGAGSVAHAVVTGGATEYDGATLDGVSVTVTDDDDPGVTLSSSTLTVTEGLTDTYTVKLSVIPTADVTVSVTAGGDVTVDPTALTFTTGTWNTAQTVTVTGTEDDDAADGAGSVAHAVVTGGATEYDGATLDGVSVTVNDDDDPGVTLSSSTLTVGEGATGEYTVELSVVPTGDVTVSVTGGGDVTVSPSALTFTTGTWNTAQTVTVTGVEDDDAADGAGSVAHAVVDGSATEYVGATLDGVAVTVSDDDDPGVTLSSSTLTVTEGATGEYTVKLSVIPTADVTVSVTAGGDVTASPSALTFTTGTWNTAQTVTVTGTEDDDAADGAGSVAHAVVTGSAPEYVGVTLDGVTVTVNDNDDPGVTLSSSTLTVTEGAEGEYTVKLSVIPTADVTVSVTAGGDVTVASGLALTFTTGMWNTAQTVTVTGTEDDDAADGAGSVAHAVVAGSAMEYVGATLDGVMVTVNDNDDPGVTLSSSSLTVAEGLTNTYTVELSAVPTADVTVSVTAGGDVTVASGLTLTFTTGTWNTAQTVTVTGTEDDDAADGAGSVAHAVVAGSAPEYVGATLDGLEVTVTDDDDPGVTLSSSTLTVTEGATGEYTVELSVIPTADVTVSVTAGGDVTVASGLTLTFTTGTWNTAQTVTVTGTEDDDAADGAGSVAHAVVAGSAMEYVGATLDGVMVTVNDNDDPGVTLSSSSLTVAEGLTNTYTVKLSVVPTAAVTVGVNSGGDVRVASGLTFVALTFSTSSWNTAQTVTVTAVHDVDAADDTVTVAHSVLSGSAPEYVGATLDGLEVTVTDDDDPGVTLSSSTLTVTEGDTGTYTVELSVIPTADVTVSVTAGGDVTVASGLTLTFTTGTWNTAQTVTVTGTEDDDAADGAGSVAHAVVAGSAPEYVGATLDGVAVTVNDDDDPGVTLSSSTLTVTEGATNTYTVKLSVIPTADVTVSVTAGGDVTVDPSALTFSTATWNTAQTVTVTAGQDDDAADGAGSVAHAVLTGSAPEYVGATLDGVAVTVNDDDDPGVTLSSSTLTVTEGATNTYTVELSVIPTNDVTVSVTAGGGVTASPSALTFSTSSWSSAQTVTVTGVEDDDAADGAGSVAHAVVAGSAPEYVGATLDGVAVTVSDNDDPAVTVSITDDNDPSSTNQAPTVSVRADRTTITAGDKVMLYSIAGDPDGDDNYLSYAWTSDGGGTFSRPRFPDTRWSAPGSAPPGTVNLTLTVTDTDGLSASATVSVEVVAALAGANDPGVTITPTQLTVAEGATATYTVVLVRQPTANVRVSLQPQRVGVTGRSVLLDTYSVEFTTTSWNIPRTVTVDAIPDGDGDDDVVPIRHKIAASSAPEYRGLDIDTLSVTVTDPDAAPKAVLTMSTRDQDVAEGGSVTITVNIDRAADYSGGANVRVGLDYAQGLVTGTGHNNPVQVRSPWGTGGTPWATESTYVDLVFAGADTSKSFTISVRDDSVRSPAGSRRIIVGIIGSITDGVVKGTRTVVYIHVPEDD